MRPAAQEAQMPLDNQYSAVAAGRINHMADQAS